LRFPSYSSEWHSYTLGEILTFYSTNSFSREKLNYDTGSVKNIHYGDIHTKFPSIVSIDNNKDIPFINDDLDLSKFSEDQYLREGDLIIADASEDYEDIGKAIEVKDINNEKVLAGLHTILARDENDMAVNGFKAYLFSTNNLKTKIKIIANGISVLGISKNNLSKLNVEIPSKKEQQNIVSFISDIDKKIELLEKKHQLYLDFKNYLMQQIFAQKLRFDKTSEWETFALNDIGKTYNGLSGLSKDNFEKGNSKYITYKSIFDNNILKSDFTENVDLNNKSQNEVKKGDLFFTGSSETPEEVGMVSVLSSTVEDCYLNSFCFGFRLNNNYDVNPLFLAYYLRSPIMRNKIMILAQGSTRFNLSKKEILKLKVEIPSISEQQQIIDLFQNVDNKINEISIQTDNFNKFKKGLLQQMFVVRINWQCNFKLAKSPSFNKHLLILKNKIIFIIIK